MPRPSKYSDSKPRTSEAFSWDSANEAFFLYQGKTLQYEYSAEATVLGPGFVSAGCAVVRAQRLEAGVNLRTWVDNYVVRLGNILTTLVSFCAAKSTSGANPSCFTTSDWQAYVTHLQEWIHEQAWANSTHSKAVQTLNKLLLILHREGVIGTRIELNLPQQSKIAKVGQSRFTQRGWDRKPSPTKIDTPYSFHVEKHGREYDYSSYRELGRLFVLHTTAFLKEYYHTRSALAAKRTHECWIGVLRYLQDKRSNKYLQEFHRKLDSDDYRCITAETWETVLYGWREDLSTDIEAGERRLITHHQRITRLNILWTEFAGSGLVPSITIRGFKNAKSSYLRKSRETLAQLTLLDHATESTIRTASEKLVSFFDDNDKSEAREYLRSLSQALSPDVVRDLPVEAVIEEIHVLNASRLAMLRQCAAADFKHWYEHWQKGEAAYRTSALNGSALVAALDSPTLSVSEIRQNSARLLKNAPERERLGYALRYIEARYEGSISGIQGRIHHLARSFGGRPNLMAYLHPHEHATLALWVLTMVDTGANCEVARATPWDCLRKSKHPNVMQVILGPKNRAGGFIIIDELDIELPDGSLSLVRAFQMYQEMAARLHSRSDGDTAKLLLMHDTKGYPQGLAEWTARIWFTEFLSRHDELRGLNALPSMIRPSVLMDVQHRNDGLVSASQAIADHAKPTTTLQHYTGRSPTKLRYALNVRAFQDRFQSIIIVTINGAAAKLGISQADFNTLLSEAARTGLGVACLDPLAGVQPGTRSGEQCTRMDKCWDCQMRWVVATVDNVADLILFNEYLNTTAEGNAEMLPEDWEERWLPWLAFTNVALQKLKESECAAVYAQAGPLANERRAEYARIPLD